MIKWLLLFMLLPTIAFASEVVCFNPDKTVSFYGRSVHTPNYSSNSDCLINPDLSALRSIDRKFWKRGGLFNNKVVEMNQAEKIQRDLDNQQTANNNARRAIDSLRVSVEDLVEALESKGLVAKQEIIDQIKTNRGL